MYAVQLLDREGLLIDIYYLCDHHTQDDDLARRWFANPPTSKNGMRLGWWRFKVTQASSLAVCTTCKNG